MGGSESSISQDIVNSIQMTIKQTNTLYNKNDNYVNNTIKNAYYASLDLLNKMNSYMSTINESEVDSVVQNIMSQSNINISGVTGSYVKVSQKFNSQQYIYALALSKVINDQSTDMQTASIAVDILKGTQGVNNLITQASALESNAEAMASALASAMASASAEAGSGTSADTDVDVKVRNETTMDIYNENISMNVNENDINNIQDYCSQVEQNLQNYNEYYANAQQSLNEITEAVNIMSQNNINITDIKGSIIKVEQVNSNMQTVISQLGTFYNNIMYDKMYHYYEQQSLKDVSQSAQASLSQSGEGSNATKASASESASSSATASSKSTSLLQDAGEALSSICSSITGPVAAVLVIVVVIIGGCLIALIVGLTKIADTAVGAFSNVSKDPGVKEAIKSSI